MRRVLWYAAAAGIFLSSALAKPAHGAMRGYTGNGCGDVTELLKELTGGTQGQSCVVSLPGNGNVSCGDILSYLTGSGNPGGSGWCGGGSSLPGNGSWCGGSAGDSSGSGSSDSSASAGQQGAEWFPGQGPDSGSWAPGTSAQPGQQNTPDILFPDCQQWPELPDILIPNVSWGSGNSGDNQNPWTGGNQGDNQNPWTGGGQGNNQNPWTGGGQGNNQNPWTGNGGSSGSGSQNPWTGNGQNGNQNGSQSPWGGNGGSPDTGNQNQSGGSGQTSYIDRIVELVNIERAAAGLSPVTASSALSSAADVRAREIVSSFSHYRPNGTYFNTVLDQRGIFYNGAGENIAYGYDTPERVMSEWMNSPGHRANILDSRFTKLGIGYYQGGNGVKYWTQLFTY